jgi:Tfp pilus assembly protein PilZ
MAQDTRKDPRAKVLSMTVRYKSATVDEFIQHHAHDVSRGGIYIKTPSPFPPGTLLKFEIRIQDEQSVLAGVGRVVWKREADQATHRARPPAWASSSSRSTTSPRVSSRASSTLRAAASRPTTEGSRAAAEAEAAKAPAGDKSSRQGASKRASTMLGFGAIGAAEVLKAAEAAKADAAGADEPDSASQRGRSRVPAGGFFPKPPAPRSPISARPRSARS